MHARQEEKGMIIQSLLERRADSNWLADFLTGQDSYFTSLAGEDVTQSSALKLSPFFNAINTISDDVAKLPAHVFKRVSGGDVVPEYDHPAAFLLGTQPNEIMDPFTFKKLLEVKRLLWGHGLAYVNVDFNGFPFELLPIPPEYVLHVIDEAGALWYVLSLPGMAPRKLPAADVIDVKGFSTDGVTAQPIQHHARESIGVGLAEQKFEGNLYKSGMKLGGVLESPGKLGPDEKDIVRREFEKMTAGLSNMHRVAVLDLGQKFTKLDMQLKDAQFVESKAANIGDISRFFKFPLYKQQEGNQNYAADEMQEINYVTGTLDPILVPYDQQYSLKLFSRREWKKYYVKINRAAQLRANLTAQATFIQGMIQNGVYTLNEARAFLELNKYKPGQENPADRLLASKNYIFLEDLAKAVGAAASPAPTTNPTSGRGEA
jgi:HK97 family phage portal protein